MYQEIDRKQKTNYISTGRGEPLILIHGVGLDHTMWQSQIEYLSSFYTVYAYDMLGHGHSEIPADIYKLEDFSNQLNDFMKMLHIESAHIIGFSMGGMVAQRFCLSFPKKVKSLIIANSVANRNDEERKSILNRVRQVENEGKKATIEQAIDRWFSKEFIKNNIDIVKKIRNRLKTNNEKAYLNAYRIFATADRELWDKLNHIQVPAFIITGENDKGSNPRMAKEMKEKIPHAEVCIVSGAKHMLPVEQASVFNKHVFYFIKQLEEVKSD